MIQPLSLKYFAEIAHSGSVRQAAEALFVVPSAISRQIANLEREFGTAAIVDPDRERAFRAPEVSTLRSGFHIGA